MFTVERLEQIGWYCPKAETGDLPSPLHVCIVHAQSQCAFSNPSQCAISNCTVHKILQISMYIFFAKPIQFLVNV